MLTVLTAAAAGTGGGTDWIQWALNQGGAFIGMLVCGYAWRKAESRADAERAARDLLAGQFMDKVIPALTESTRVQREFVELARNRPHI